MADSRFYKIVSDEIARGYLDPGVKAKAYAESGGVETAAKALYLKLRAEQLEAESRSRTSSMLGRKIFGNFWVYPVTGGIFGAIFGNDGGLFAGLLIGTFVGAVAASFFRALLRD